MGQSMVGRLAIKARQIQPGDAFAAAVPAGGLVEVVDLEGQQVAELVAFDRADHAERLSLGVTRYESQSIFLSLGMRLFSSRGRAMLELVEDTVGRHDLLWALPTGPEEPESGDGAPGEATTGEDNEVAADAPIIATADAGNGSREPEVTEAVADDTPSPGAAEGTASPDEIGDAVSATSLAGSGTDQSAAAAESVASNGVAHAPDPSSAVGLSVGTPRASGFTTALEPFGLSGVDAPDPVNLFMQLAVMQQGELEVREPMSQRGDRVVFRALSDLVVAVRCSDAADETNAGNPTDILVRVYR